MDLYSNTPYWLLKNGLLNAYPAVDKNYTTEVVIIGAGISGALMGYHLMRAGLELIIVDKRHVGMGSTAASTALIQYEIDQPLRKLIPKVGEQNAVQAYRLSIEAIQSLEKIARYLKHDSFEKKPSLQFASYKKDLAGLKREYEIRRNLHFPVEWLSESDLIRDFNIRSSGGILSDCGGQMDPYLFTHDLIRHIQRAKSTVFDSTEIIKIRRQNQKLILTTHSGHTITTKYLVIAAGYEAQQYLPKSIQQFRATYAMVTEPLEQKHYWYKNALVWETADPYMYIRTTTDNRVIVGGKDTDFYGPFKRKNALKSKAAALVYSFSKLMPHIPFRADFCWTGTFANTKDGLPYIGELKKGDDIYFALGYGGNGITFSLLAAEIITDGIKGRRNKDASIFSFHR
jgi:glycine/D-amino acid oxidase-like deaminating enzyme